VYDYIIKITEDDMTSNETGYSNHTRRVIGELRKDGFSDKKIAELLKSETFLARAEFSACDKADVSRILKTEF